MVTTVYFDKTHNNGNSEKRQHFCDSTFRLYLVIIRNEQHYKCMCFYICNMIQLAESKSKRRITKMLSFFGVTVVMCFIKTLLNIFSIFSLVKI